MYAHKFKVNLYLISYERFCSYFYIFCWTLSNFVSVSRTTSLQPIASQLSRASYHVLVEVNIRGVQSVSIPEEKKQYELSFYRFPIKSISVNWPWSRAVERYAPVPSTIRILDCVGTMSVLQ